MTIHSLPLDERPREKMLAQGSTSLSDAELLAIFLRTGVAGSSAIDVSRQLINSAGSLRNLLAMSKLQLCQFKGIGPTKFVQLQAALELGKRYLYEQIERGQAMSSPDVSKDYLQMKLRDKPYEVFFALFLDTKHRVIHHQEMFRGTIDGASVPIREVVKDALEYNASAMIVAHNHPSGVAEPSEADRALTETLKLALQMVGIKLLDHFVVGDGEVVSFAELGLMQMS